MKLCICKAGYTANFDGQKFEKYAVVYKDGERVDMLKLPRAKGEELNRGDEFEVDYGYNSKDKNYYVKGVTITKKKKEA